MELTLVSSAREIDRKLAALILAASTQPNWPFLTILGWHSYETH
jgi:hypothetical protein